MAQSERAVTITTGTPRRRAREQPRKFKSAHARHVNVSDDAVAWRVRFPGDELLRGCKSACAISERAQALDKSHPE